MRAVALTQHLPVTDANALVDLELPAPEPGPHDLLVRVHAVSVNPVDTKVRRPKPGVGVLPAPRVLGWDAAGRVEAVGSEVRRFRPGDEVYYAGSITRAGCNSELHTVDERIVGRKPRSLDFAEAAALPLTALTGWEALFDRLAVRPGTGGSLLIIGGAGGVGSLAIQIGRHAGLRVIATASRPETQTYCRELGAQLVIDHRQPLREQLKAGGFEQVDYILNTADTAGYWDACCELVAPLGGICSIVETNQPLALGSLMGKSARFAWELMFTRARFGVDLEAQGRVLDQVAELVEQGVLRTTLTARRSPICAATLLEAHALLESGRAMGKLVLEGWADAAAR